MCGIAGIVGAGPEAQVDPALVRKMCRTIVHRGPDDEGVYAWGPVGLGMRRLSIIDLAGGQQPIHNEDRSIWIVFNGEIYNFLELRPELERAGHRFYTNSDTETIVHLYEEYGSECVSKLRGMFGFALYDFRQSKLLLARDRLGKKPLHYAFHNNQLLFGSEIKSLLAAEPELAETNPAALMQYFAHAYIPDPLTAFRNVYKLPPGHLLEFSRGKLQVRQYWDLPRFGTRDEVSETECLDLLERELEKAVKIRLISEVPLGALLSGGVDSSLVVALMARASSSPVKTFSIAFRDESFNESEHAAKVAETFATDHHELYVDADLSDTLEKLTHHIDEPFGDSSMVPTYHVCRLARQHVTVALTGDGGDELFAGYTRYGVHAQRAWARLIPAPLRSLYLGVVNPLVPAWAPGKRYAANLCLPERDRYLEIMSVLYAWGRDRAVFSPDFVAACKGNHDPLWLVGQFFDHGPALDPISRLQYLDTKTYLAGDVLVKVDRMSMANSLEVRSPILDHVFAELAASLPVQWKFRGGEKKYILKKLAERAGVPREVIYRRKQGFAMPLARWFRRELKEEISRVLLEPRTLQRGYFQERGVRNLLNEHLSGRRDRSQELWVLLVFELWFRNFAEGMRQSDNVAPCGATRRTRA